MTGPEAAGRSFFEFFLITLIGAAIVGLGYAAYQYPLWGSVGAGLWVLYMALRTKQLMNGRS